jgi:hypothetical protein
LFPLFADGVVDAGGANLLANPKIFEMTLMSFSGAWGKLIYEKN